MRYNGQTCAVELSAEELCRHALSIGDLFSKKRVDEECCKRDDELYYRLQAEAGAYYATDLQLCNTVMLDGIYYTVTSLPDGVIRKDSPIPDKVRCVKGKEALLPPDELSLALLKCSAYFLCVKEDLSRIKGRISYYNIDTKRLKYFYYNFEAEGLREFFMELMSSITYLGDIFVERECELLPRAKDATFPYSDLRCGQEQMIKECYSAIKSHKRIFVEAPTGIGKTISSIYPAVKALGMGFCDKIFYLTPKSATRKEAFSAAAKLYEAGSLLRTVVISAKDQICPEGRCSASLGGRGGCREDCPYAKGYYDRVDDALSHLLHTYRGYSARAISEAAQRFCVCPYELSLDLSKYCDMIICDYNYAFDPLVYFKRYFGAMADQSEKYLFLIDEAHNLPDRVSEMYSASLSADEFAEVTSPLSQEDAGFDELKQLTSPVIKAFLSVKRLCKDEILKDDEGNEYAFYLSDGLLEGIQRSLSAFLKKGESWIRKNPLHLRVEYLSSLCYKIRRYLTVSEYFDSNFKCFAQIFKGDISVKIYCSDTSSIMNSLLCRADSAVMFSATLTPTDYYCDILGGGRGCRSISIESPFPAENLCIAIADGVDTRFDSREKNAKRFAGIIAATVSPRAGNYIAYFPSYKCLEDTLEEFKKKYPRVETVVQRKNMSALQKETFLAAFKADEGHLRVGFCVLGGVFSEGVDLPGTRLIGTIIFGVGLPGLSNERNMIKEHFEQKHEGEGYDYAYTYPGMNNVLQAAGRVIRKSDDRGVVVLADDRYILPKYRQMFPAHWKSVKYVGNASSLAEIIRRFWQNQ